MEVSYKKLWKLLIDKDMKKKDLQAAAGISWTSVTKLSKGESQHGSFNESMQNTELRYRGYHGISTYRRK